MKDHEKKNLFCAWIYFNLLQKYDFFIYLKTNWKCSDSLNLFNETYTA